MFKKFIQKSWYYWIEVWGENYITFWNNVLVQWKYIKNCTNWKIWHSKKSWNAKANNIFEKYRSHFLNMRKKALWIATLSSSWLGVHCSAISQTSYTIWNDIRSWKMMSLAPRWLHIFSFFFELFRKWGRKQRYILDAK